MPTTHQPARLDKRVKEFLNTYVNTAVYGWDVQCTGHTRVAEILEEYKLLTHVEKKIKGVLVAYNNITQPYATNQFGQVDFSGLRNCNFFYRYQEIFQIEILTIAIYVQLF